MSEGVFANLIGHKGAKLILREALRVGDVHILLSGPPGSGKTVALQAIEENVDGAEFKEARGYTETQLRDALAEDNPILLMDEIDAMRNQAFNALPTAMESGRVTKDTAHEQYDVEISTQIVAACNHPEDLPGHVADRFRVVNFEEYTYQEYEDVCAQMLPESVGWIETEREAREVARVVHDAVGSKSTRDAKDAAKLAGEVDRVGDVSKALTDSKADVESKPLQPEEIAQSRERENVNGDTMEPFSRWQEKACEHVRDSKLAYKSGRYRCPDCAEKDGVDVTTPIEG